MEKNNENINVIELEKGKYYQVPWGNPTVGTPYLAKIKGLNPKYTFERQFVKPTVLDKENGICIINVNNIEVGAIYEMKNPSSWKHPDTRTYFKVLKIEDGKMFIEYLEKKDVILLFSDAEETKSLGDKK